MGFLTFSEEFCILEILNFLQQVLILLLLSAPLPTPHLFPFFPPLFSLLLGVGDQCDVSDINTLNTAGKILGINNELLRKLLTSKSMITRGEEFVMHLKLVESQSARDSLAMTIYNKLFGWLVESINGLLNMHRESRAMIGEFLSFFFFFSFISLTTV